MAGLLRPRAVGAVAVVEAPVSQWYAQRARVTFLAVAFTSAVVTAVVMSVFASLPLSIVAGVAIGVGLGFSAALVVRAWPVLRVLWWWAFELFTASVVLTAWSLLARQTSAWLAAAVLGLVLVPLVVITPVREFISAWSWCVVVRHRLRSCFVGIVRGSGGIRPGSLPLILWAKPTPAGERVWLWLRPGLAVEDLDGKTSRIAVACVANQVRIVRASERYAALIRVDVARRDPLAGRVDSPLALLIPRPRPEKGETPRSAAAPPVGLDLADIPEPPAPEPPRGGRR